MSVEDKAWRNNYDGISVTVTRDPDLKYDYSANCSDEKTFYLAIVFSSASDYYSQLCESDLSEILDVEVFPEAKNIVLYDQLIAFLHGNSLSFEQTVNLFGIDIEQFNA